ncbi:MAG TPA: bacteriohemerythrin [bacterium]|nr:bacteriohemerythrin [bacterium]
MHEDHGAGCTRFVPESALRLLGRNDVREVRAGDIAELVATIAFIDLRNFTAISEVLTPEGVVRFLNDWYGTIEPLITEYDGFIDKYVGDAALAVFIGPVDRAVRCCVEIVKAVEELSRGRLMEGLPPLRAGIGLNTGIVAFAAVGSANRVDITVIGDTVNVAARLEAMTKTYGVDIMLSEQTYARLKDLASFELRFLDRIVARGKKIPLSVYEAYGGDPETRRETKKRLLPDFDRAVAWYHYGRVDEAHPLLERCADILPDDGACIEYLRRCVEFERTGLLEQAVEMKVYPVWGPEFSVGHKTIDLHHKKLFESVAVLMRMIDAGDFSRIGSVVEFLAKYVDIHFRTEEDLMKSCSYTFYEDHKAQHDRFALVFADLVRELQAGGHNGVYVAFRVRILIVDWLLNHTTKADPHLGHFLAKAVC